MQSGSVSVSTQPRVIRQTIYQSQIQSTYKCFICDENIVGQALSLTDSETISTREKVTKKLAKMVGDDFCVIVSEEDVICRRCLALFNMMDKHESELETVRTKLRVFINKKYGIDDQEEPPIKIQKLNSGSPSYNRWQNNSDESPSLTRKIVSSSESPIKTIYQSAANATNNSPAGQNKRGPIKLYKCIACDFKTTDLNAFQPHSNVCKGQNNRAATTPTVNRAPVRQQQFSGPSTIQRNIIRGQPEKLSPQKVGHTTIVRGNQTILQCTLCNFKTNDRPLFQEHQQNHKKFRPFKCKMCLERFETRDAAQIHAKTHSSGFVKRDTSQDSKPTDKFKITQQEVIVMGRQNNNNESKKGPIQKPLTDIIKEALSEDDQDVIEFHSCNICSLTFVNKKLFAQHMKTHESPVDKVSDEPQVIFHNAKGKQQETLDLESIFEKMHSEGSHQTMASNGDKNVLITTQESGGITYNITIPQDDDIPQASDSDEVRTFILIKLTLFLILVCYRNKKWFASICRI